MWEYQGEHEGRATSLQKTLDGGAIYEDLEDEPDIHHLESETDPDIYKDESAEEAPDTVVLDEDHGTGEDVPDKTIRKDLGLLVIGGANDDLENIRDVSLITESGVCRTSSLPHLPRGRRGAVAGKALITFPKSHISYRTGVIPERGDGVRRLGRHGPRHWGLLEAFKAFF